VPPSRLRVVGDRFLDALGRSVLLRGINLGGDSKVPYPDGGTNHPSDFSDHREVSFVGRPFPLAEADEHLARLRRWGCNCLRLLTTWEAVEHRGPGIYDEDYLDFFQELCRRAGEHDLYLFVDFHQDVWSRMSGGDGAPGWTFEAVGLDLQSLGPADAALVMQQRYDYADPRPRQEDNFPRMCWIDNYQYPANAILWTLFFGGRDFAPGLEVEGRNVQDWLQDHYLGSQRAVAARLRDMPHVIGFGTLNEPGSGWIGVGMDQRPSVDSPDAPTRPGLAWSPLLGLAAAAGRPVTLDDYQISLARLGCVPVRTVTANSAERCIWLEGRTDPFRAAGAWELEDGGAPRSDREDYFQRVDGREVDFDRDYLRPFFHRVADGLREINPEWITFIEKDATHAVSHPDFPDGLPAQVVNATHWYDAIILLTKRFRGWISFDPERGRPALGRGGIARLYRRQLGRLQAASRRIGPGCPTLVGEFGIPFDMNGARAYAAYHAGDRSERPWRRHVLALELAYEALDALLLNATLWNYSAGNRNDPRVGDGWNQEDLSVFSRDQQDAPTEPDSGGRALAGFVRPFARRVQGTITEMRFDRQRGIFILVYDADPGIEAPTEIYVPRLQFPDGFTVDAAGLEVETDDEAQLLRLATQRAGRHTVTVQRRRRS